MSSSSMFCELASVAIAAIALQTSIKEGGGNIATLTGDRHKISPDNIQIRDHFLPANKDEERRSWKLVSFMPNNTLKAVKKVNYFNYLSSSPVNNGH